MKVTSSGDLKLEDLPGAPDGEWLRIFTEDYNDLKRQVVAAMRALTLADNTKYREKSVDLVHDTATEVGVPKDMRGIKIKSVCALEVSGLTLATNGKPNGSIYALGLSVPLAWYRSTDEDEVIVTAKYDITPSAGVTARINLLFVGE